MKHKLITYVRAGYPGLFVVSAEEARAESVLKEVATELGRRLHAWSITEGFINTESGSIREAPDPLEALNEIDRLEDNQMVVLRDYHLFLDNADPVILRKLRDVLRRAKAGGKTVILLGCRSKIPVELQREITVVEFALPTSKELERWPGQTEPVFK